MASAPSHARTDSGGGVLTAGFYQLTLVAVALTAAEVRVRIPGGPSVGLFELAVAPGFLCLVAEVLSRRTLRVRMRDIYRQNRALMWYGGYAAVAAFVGLTRSSTTLQTFHDLFVALGLYALVGTTVDSHARLRGLLGAALAGAMANIGLAVLQIGTGGPYPVALSESIEYKLDLGGERATQFATGLFSHPNGLAVFLVPVVLFLLVAAWAGFRATPRRGPLAAAVLVCALVALKVTYAKGVYAWLSVGIFLLVLPRRFDRHRIWLAIALPVVGVTAITWMSVRAFLEGDRVFGSIISRIELWLATLDILRSDSFVAAFGGGGSQLASRTFTIEYANAHNAWLDQALTYGIPALVLYLGAYITAFRSLVRQIRSETHPVRTLALTTFAALVAILGESFLEPSNHSIVLQSQLCLLFAIAAIAPVLRQPQPRAAPGVNSPR